MDNLTASQRRKNMQNIRSQDTIPEIIVKKHLKRYRVSFSQHLKSLPGKPDFVFRSKKTVVFVDSDFWHGRKSRFIMPATNVSYWKQKIKANQNRDKKVNQTLKNLGWRVIRIWEYNIKKSTDKTLLRLISKLQESPRSIVARGVITNCTGLIKTKSHRQISILRQKNRGIKLKMGAAKKDRQMSGGGKELH